MGAPIPRTLTLMLGGTSLTTGRLCTPPLPWTYFLAEDMRASPHCKGPVVIINTGRGSQTSTWGAEQAALMAPLRPDVVLMEDFGINDCAFGVSIPQATTNFNSMVASYRAWNPDVILAHQTMSPASAGDASRATLPDYYDNGLLNAALNDMESLDNYYGTPLVPGGWPKPLPVSLTVGDDPLPNIPSGFSIITPTETWSATDKSSNITVNYTGLIATRTVAPGNAWVSARGAVSVNSGRWYFECTPTNVGQAVIGISQSALTVASQYVGQTATSWGYNSNGSLYNNAGVIDTYPAYSSGSVIGVALDLTNNRLWFRVNGGNWNNSGSADPSTNTGGIAITAGTYFPAMSLTNLGDLWTAHFGAIGDGLHPIWPAAFQIYSYPNILAWAERIMQDFWP